MNPYYEFLILISFSFLCPRSEWDDQKIVENDHCQCLESQGWRETAGLTYCKSTFIFCIGQLGIISNIETNVLLSSFGHKVTIKPSSKALGTSLEKIQQLFQKLKLSSLSQSFSSTAPSDTDLGESLGANVATTDSDERDDASVCSGGDSTDDGGYRSSMWDQGDILGSGSGTSLEEALEAPAPDLARPEFCYEAESPDEAALVHAAHAYSFTLVSRTPEQVTVRLPQGTCLTFSLLCTLGFDSVRKRMSVVVRHPLTGEIIVYTKGADSVIMDLLEDPACGKSCLTRVPGTESSIVEEAVWNGNKKLKL